MSTVNVYNCARLIPLPGKPDLSRKMFYIHPCRKPSSGPAASKVAASNINHYTSEPANIITECTIYLYSYKRTSIL